MDLYDGIKMLNIVVVPIGGYALKITMVNLTRSTMSDLRLNLFFPSHLTVIGEKIVTFGETLGSGDLTHHLVFYEPNHNQSMESSQPWIFRIVVCFTQRGELEPELYVVDRQFSIAFSSHIPHPIMIQYPDLKTVLSEMKTLAIASPVSIINPIELGSILGCSNQHPLIVLIDTPASSNVVYYLWRELAICLEQNLQSLNIRLLGYHQTQLHQLHARFLQNTCADASLQKYQLFHEGFLLGQALVTLHDYLEINWKPDAIYKTWLTILTRLRTMNLRIDLPVIGEEMFQKPLTEGEKTVIRNYLTRIEGILSQSSLTGSIFAEGGH